MKKVSSKTADIKITKPTQYEKKIVNFSKFTPDILEKDLHKLFPSIGNIQFYPFAPIDVLSCTKTKGSGRTNITIIMPTIVQVDAATPYAGFDRRLTPSRNPLIQIHFDPAAYGITYNATYIIEFTIDAADGSTFNLTGYSLAGTLVNAGTKVLNGPSKVSLIIRNMPPTVTYAYLEQISGGVWNWYSTKITFPPLVISL